VAFTPSRGQDVLAAIWIEVEDHGTHGTIVSTM
jgi:hypothetical protein